MVSNNLRVLHVMTTLLIVYESSLTPPAHALSLEVSDGAAAATSLKGTEMDVHSQSHINKPMSIAETGMFNRMPRHIVQGQNQKNQQQTLADELTTSGDAIKRSYSINTGNSGSLASTLNGLASISSALQHIKSSAYDASTGYVHQNTHQQALPPTSSTYTEAKPIYENQEEHHHGYATASADSQYYGTGGSGGSASHPAVHSAIYNLQTAGTHNVGALSNGNRASMPTSSAAYNGGSDGFLPSWNFGKLSTSFAASSGAAASTPYHNYHSTGTGAGTAIDESTSGSSNNDKISEGNFLHHYDSASGYNEFTHQQQFQQLQQELPHQSYEQSSHNQHNQQHDDYINSVEQAGAPSSHSPSSSSYEDYNPEHDHSNYLPPSAGGVGSGADAGGGHHEQQKQPDVINYVPYPVVKKLHVPVHEQVKIPVSHAVIIPVSKPVPIHIPVTQNVQVPIEKELRIPVERVVPYPIEKHVPVPVEKRVPYEVVKYIPIKVPRPFPVKVPVFKTVLHKVKKSWW